MNLNEATGENGGACKHGCHWTSPAPCGKCISERRGVWVDYGGYGHPYEASRHGEIHCAKCDRALAQAELEALATEAAANGRYVRSFNGKPGETDGEKVRLWIDHCRECESWCRTCQETKSKRALDATEGQPT